MMKAAIFDMDGTILDSMDMWRSFAPRFCEKYGIDWNEKLQTAVMTMSFVDAAGYFCEHFPHLGYEKDGLLELWFSLLALDYKAIVTVKPNVAAYLEKLNRQGIRCGVATMTEHPICDDALELHGLRRYFEFVITYEDAGMKGKEHPDIFLEAARRLGSEPADCVVFEDSLFAIKTARAAGFSVYGVDDNGKNDSAGIIPLCEKFIHDFSELL